MSVEEHTSKFFESSYDGKCLLFQCNLIFAMTSSVAREVGNQPSFFMIQVPNWKSEALVCILNHFRFNDMCATLQHVQ